MNIILHTNPVKLVAYNHVDKCILYAGLKSRSYQMIDLTKLKHFHLFRVYTDMSKGIAHLSAIVQEQYELSVYQEIAVSWFYCRRIDRYNALLFDHYDFLHYQWIDNGKLRRTLKSEEIRKTKV